MTVVEMNMVGDRPGALRKLGPAQTSPDPGLSLIILTGDLGLTFLRCLASLFPPSILDTCAL